MKLQAIKENCEVRDLHLPVDKSVFLGGTYISFSLDSMIFFFDVRDQSVIVLAYCTN